MNSRLKRNVTNNEFFRLPQMNQEKSFVEMQLSVSESYAQYMLGPFPESEHQKPYDNDGDYQNVENDFAPWGYPSYIPYDYPGMDWPGFELPEMSPNCVGMWERYFGNWKGGVPRDWMYAGIGAMLDAGCMKYIPRYCCPNVWEVKAGDIPNKNKRAAGSASIIGPAEVKSGETVEYKYIHATKGCTYNWDAKQGWIVSGTYTAPTVTEETTDTISVHPFMGDDASATCAERKIKITPGCPGIIGYTTQQMSVNGTQELTVTDGSESDTYTWSVAGGGSIAPETGLTVTYTAPSTNAECASNPTISLSCGGNVLDTLKIAVNALSSSANAVTLCENRVCPPCGTYFGYCGSCLKAYYCSGEARYAGNDINCQCIGWGPDPPNDANGNSGQCAERVPPYAVGWADVRTTEMKTAGCCPAQLL